MLNSSICSCAMLAIYLVCVVFLPVHWCIFECIMDNYNGCFTKIGECQRFLGPIISKRNFRTLERCSSHARERRGLAFNYSPPENANLRMKNGDYGPNCEILGCAATGFAGIVNDSAYDYYSFYESISQEATCIKSIGMFYLIQEKMNYIDAVGVCQRMGGDLANVVSERRTYLLSQLLLNRISDWHKVAYIGLDDRKKEGRFVTSSGNHLSCYKYRAWGPGQPTAKHKSEDCVLLDSEEVWRVVDCKLRFPVLCEIYPNVAPCWAKVVYTNRSCALK